MTAANGTLRNDLTRAQIALDRMEPGSVVVDEFGAAWQLSGVGYWYRAFDAPGVPSFEMAQRIGKFTPVPVASESDQ